MVSIPIPPDILEYMANLLNYKMGIEIENLRDLYRLGYAAGGLAAIADVKKAL